MQQIIINSKDKESSTSESSAHQSVTCGKYFEAFVESQKKGYQKPDGSIKKKGITAEGAINLREETTHILTHCNPHDATTNSETTHLVVGYVQSGKTMSFTALTALALDNGYRVIVFLAGTKNNLLDQTSKRLRKDLIDGVIANNDYYKIHVNPTADAKEEIAGHIESSEKPIILIPILKQYTHINRLTELFKSYDFKNAMTNETVLIIDDEADQASLNSYGRKNSKKDEDEDPEASRTYESILKMRAALPGNSFIQYTATPQANILISMRDMLSPKSHTLLTPGEGYIGGKLFFGKGKNNELYNGQLICEIPEGQVFHKKRNVLTKMPQSLKDALMLHIMAVAIIVKFLKVEDIFFLSMMVHPDDTKKWNKKFKEWIERELHNWRVALKKPIGQDDREDLLSRFRNLFPQAVKFYTDEEKPTFEQIEPYISDIINDKKVWLVNTDKDAETEIEWNNFKMHILVGAQMLNRGFTIENLATTYMPRYTLGPTNADTIEQRCRFFGYKKDYIESCRIFLPKNSIEEYKAYVDHEEELRSMLKTCDTLAAVEHKILLSPRLRPTRQNVLPVYVVNSKLIGMQGLQAFASKSIIEENDRLVETFLKQHENDFDIFFNYNTDERTHKGFKLPIDQAIEFLSDFRLGFPDVLRKVNTIRYLKYLSSEDNDNPLKYVYFIQMAYKAPNRKRSFDNEKLRLAANTGIFAGPSREGDSSNYLGDSKIVGGEDTISIQLHHFLLKPVPIDFPRNAYTIAIYYPPKLAVNYCANLGSSQNVEFEEETEDDE